MIVKPKVRGFICTTAHPVGCEAVVKSEIDYVKSKKAEDNGFKPKKVLVLGSSMGYGLASRISLAFAGGAATLGIMFDRPASGNKTGTSGWYNTQAFEKYAKADGLYARTVNGDASARRKSSTSSRRTSARWTALCTASRLREEQSAT